MSKLVKGLVGAAVAAAGIYVIGKYLHDYTDYKAAGSEDLDGIKQGGSNMKDAAKRTYVAIREKGDVKTPVNEMGQAFGEIASGTGKLINAVGSNTVQFVKDETERYKDDPEAYRSEVKDNFKDMGQQAANVFNNIKDGAADLAADIKEKAENFKNRSENNVPEYCAIPVEESKEKFTEVSEDVPEVSAEQISAEQAGADSEETKGNGVIISDDTEKLN